MTYTLTIYDSGKFLNEMEQYGKFQELWARKEFDVAYPFISNLISSHPDNYDYNRNIIEFCLTWFNYQSFIESIPFLEGDDNVLDNRIIIGNAFVRDCMERAFYNLNFYHLLSEKDDKLLAGALHLLASFDDSWRLVKDNFLRSRVLPHTTDIFKHGIAFYSNNLNFLKFILPVIYALPYCLVTIVIGKLEDAFQDIVEEIKQSGYTILYGTDKLADFRIIATDQWHFGMDLKNFDFTGKTVISYGHGVEVVPFFPDKYNLFLAASEFQINGCYNYAIDQGQCKALRHLTPGKRQEHAYTGPWHIGNFLQEEHIDKAMLRGQIAARYNRDIPADKLLITIFDDGMTPLYQQVIAANALAKSHVVVFKWYQNMSDNLKSVMSPDIIAYDKGWAPNDLRFASDFILCGYISSTALSCIMLGLKFIPFYARTLRYSWEPQHITHKWMDNLPGGKSFVAPTSRQIFLAVWPRLFDIDDVKSIMAAIDEPDYISWYEKSLPKLQKIIFGNYILNGAVEKTAEYILRFACYGTLGKDCLGINYIN